MDMAKKNGLSVRTIAALTKPGFYGDGNGLYVQITPNGRSWVFRFQMAGRRRDMGLGSLDVLSLAEARDRVHDARKLILDGKDPIEVRKAARVAALAEAAKAITFQACAEKYIAANKAGWKNAKHAEQWRNTLTTYAYPTIGELPVAAIDVAHVTTILEPIWATKSETASRVRGRIETVLDYARAHKWRQGENPALWKGHLENILPKRSKVKKQKHHPALPFDAAPVFMRQLRALGSVSARALEFLILTATRTNEVILATPAEIKGDVWTIPEGRMKGEREHRVPLSARAVELVEQMKQDHPGPYLFPGGKVGRPLSNMAMLQLMRGMKREDGEPWTDDKGRVAVPHGFRSSFRDWVAERTSFSREVAEMALAHAVDDKTEAAYRRGDLFDKRRRMMGAWADYCAATKATVVKLRG
jgi:integrase